jgi:hypothetical protein
MNNPPIETLKEQISFLEARIGRYEELANGSALKRWGFAGSKLYLTFLGMFVAVIVLIVAILTSYAVKWLLIILALGLLAYSVRLLININHQTRKQLFVHKISRLKIELQSMEKELAVLKQQEKS